MSDRVSRLAELRKKRDFGAGKGPGGASGNIKDEDRSPTKAANGNDLKDVGNGSKEDTSKGSTIGEDSSVVAPRSAPSTPDQAVITQDHAEPRKDEKNETDFDKITYNSDLKRDISSLLAQAQAGTERALNEIIWKSYLQKQAD